MDNILCLSYLEPKINCCCHLCSNFTNFNTKFHNFSIKVYNLLIVYLNISKNIEDIKYLINKYILLDVTLIKNLELLVIKIICYYINNDLIDIIKLLNTLNFLKFTKDNKNILKLSIFYKLKKNNYGEFKKIETSVIDNYLKNNEIFI